MVEQTRQDALEAASQIFMLKNRVLLSLADVEHQIQTLDPKKLEGCHVVHQEFGIGRILMIRNIISICFSSFAAEESIKKFEKIKRDCFWFIGVNGELFEQMKSASARPLEPRNQEAVQITIEIIKLLRNNQPERARTELETKRHLLLPYETGLLSEQIRKTESKSLKKVAVAALKEFRFIEADCLQEEYALFTNDEYLEKKAEQITRAFKHVQALSDEQALAIAANGNQKLVKARAGSGKTRVLAAKTRYLVEFYGIEPDLILVMAFNKKAAAEIRHRIQNVLQVNDFSNARTFHSLAFKLVNPERKILFDNGNEEFSRQALSECVKQVFHDILDAELYEQLNQFFRRELRSLENTQAFLNDADYYVYRRNYRDVSLAREHVKSAGEKFIADFLFEHDINYNYEPVEFWSGGQYRPDFSLTPPYFARKYFIEHWGVDPDDPLSNPPDWWRTSREAYCVSIKDKRKYCETKGITLIETSVADLTEGREVFEESLKEKLEALRIPCQKLPREELEKLVIHNQKNRLIRLLVQFIQKAKKRSLSSDDAKAIARSHKTFDERERIFLKAACRVYEAYQEKLSESGQLDFDDLLADATKMIRRTGGECCLDLDSRTNRTIAIKKLRWLLLDEYQDLSHSFFDLIQAIQEVNPAVQLMCVGDDWQAINGFAGSDLMYMNKFSKLFPGAETHHLLTNYRSERRIIASGNELMAGLGKPGRNLPEKNNGEVNLVKVDKIYIESQQGDAFAKQRKLDNRFKFFRETSRGPKIHDNGFLQAKYLKACFEIITDAENLRLLERVRDEKNELAVAILSRTRYLYRIQLDEFGRKLNTIFTDEQKRMIGDLTSKIRIGTVHSFKGLEAEIVIVLRATQGAFPLIHPDNALFRLFGETEASALAEERRLFYAALTRAASKTYLLTETGRESDYLDELEGQNLITTISP